MNRRLNGRVEFITVYVREAHPIDGWRTPANDRAGIMIKQPVTLEERCTVAGRCYQALQMQTRLVVDEIDDRVGRAYCAEPDRLYVIDRDGRVAYQGGPGPFGFNPAEMLQTLSLLLIEEEQDTSSTSE